MTYIKQVTNCYDKLLILITLWRVWHHNGGSTWWTSNLCINLLNHSGLAMVYGSINLGQHCLSPIHYLNRIDQWSLGPLGPLLLPWLTLISAWMSNSGVYTKFSGRLSEEPFPWLIQKFLCILIFKIGQPGCQLNLSEGQIRLDLMSGRPLV